MRHGTESRMRCFTPVPYRSPPSAQVRANMSNKQRHKHGYFLHSCHLNVLGYETNSRVPTSKRQTLEESNTTRDRFTFTHEKNGYSYTAQCPLRTELESYTSVTWRAFLRLKKQRGEERSVAHTAAHRGAFAFSH
jgi:hypothetical protein